MNLVKAITSVRKIWNIWKYRPLLEIRKQDDAHKKKEGHFVYPPYANRKFLMAET